MTQQVMIGMMMMVMVCGLLVKALRQTNNGI